MKDTIETKINIAVENVPGMGFVVVLNTPERAIYLNENAAINMAEALLDLSEKAEKKNQAINEQNLKERRPALRVVGGGNAVH